MSAYEIRGGLAGEILRVDLSRNKIWTEDTRVYARRLLGGRAVNSLILLNEMSPETKWSDPENMLIFGVGCLVGTMAPGANRVSIETKNVYSGGKGSANFGGHFGPELKYAGFDHVVITGRAETPVYLWIHDGRAEIRDAGSVWGRTTYETEAMLQAELGDDRIEVAAIGPAGENLVKGACVIGDLSKVAGGSGVGCVMGGKNLKALVARGHGSIEVADPARFMEAVDDCLTRICGSPRTARWRKGIIEAGALPESPFWDIGAETIRNGQIGHWPMEKRMNLVGHQAGVPKYRQRMLGCFNCPAGCMPYFEIGEGPFAGTKGVGYWIGSAMYSTRFDVDDAAASIKFHLLCNEFGLDGDMAATVLSWAFECYERDLISREDTGGLALEWGDGVAMNAMVEKLAYREGIGDLLADGVKEAARRLGKGSDDFAVHIKGQDTSDAFRIQKGWGLGCSTSACGPRHLRGAVGNVHHSGPKNLPRETSAYENQPEAVFWQVRAKEIEDLTGFCNFMGTYSGPHALEIADYAELTSAALGIEIAEEELMWLAQAGCNLEKAFNTLHAGFTRADDYPPKRYMDVPIDAGPYAGHKCDRDEWDRMLDRLYDLHGWDVATGLQTRSGLEELGLGDIADRLEQAGRLVATGASIERDRALEGIVLDPRA
ncbi:MAG: aldehyde ferredoxin oxidoreductase C-terminal domain-containing protein [bacterium]